MLAILTRTGLCGLLALTIILSLTDAHPNPLLAATSRTALTSSHAGINLVGARAIAERPAVVAILK